ncbi:MAG: hypothetical protein NUV51_08275 [Sulfuricaulis sp.]|nr:hypothetical protein [Sulfuricaulis sp.]
MKLSVLVFGFLILSCAAYAQSPREEPLRTFLVECDSNIDDCRDLLNYFILGGIRISNNPEPTCISLKGNAAADKMLNNLRDLARDPWWAKEPYRNALMQAMTDAFPCLTKY